MRRIQDSAVRIQRKDAAEHAGARRRDLPEWQKEALIEADRVESDDGSRYIEVSRTDSRTGYRDREDFIATVLDPRFQKRPGAAIAGRGAFRRFQDALLDDPDERDRWHAFQAARVRARVLDGLDEQGIEPIVE